jgi:hypothetical protein
MFAYTNNYLYVMSCRRVASLELLFHSLFEQTSCSLPAICALFHKVVSKLALCSANWGRLVKVQEMTYWHTIPIDQH